MWCNVVGNNRRDCVEFVEALRRNVVYLWNGRVHASDTRRAVDTNFGRGGMKWLMEEAKARHADTVHYSALARIRVGGDEDRKTKHSGFWPSVLEDLSGPQL